MKSGRLLPVMTVLLCGSAIAGIVGTSPAIGLVSAETDSDSAACVVDSCELDSVAEGDFNEPMPKSDEADRYKKLSDEDFAVVAKELNVEVAAIKAVVRIEAGAQMVGFWAPGVPIINPDRSLYNKYARLAKNRAGDKNAKVPSGLTGIAHSRWTKLTQWRKVNAEGADMGTLWGMFQISGAGYKQCGCSSVKEFVERMSRSEFDQLELFAAFITNTGMVEYIRKKDWAAFARRYNGPSYARRGYHTKMAREYAKFKKQ